MTPATLHWACIVCWLRCITLSHSNFPTILGGGNISQCSLVQSEHVAEPGFNLDPLAQTANFIHPHQVDANIISIWLFLLCCHVQLFVTPCPPGSSVHGIFQARILKWLPFPPAGDLPNSGISCISCICRQILLPLCHLGSPMKG